MAKTPHLIWSKSMSVGVHSLDSDHKLLFSLFTQLDEAVAAGEGLATVGSMLNALAEYMAYHFAREEALMGACAHRGRVKHAQDHARIMESLIGLRDGYLSRHHHGLSSADLTALAKFILDHFEEFDRAYVGPMKTKREAVHTADVLFAKTSLGETEGAGAPPDLGFE